MLMIQNILIVFGLCLFVENLFHKWGIWRQLNEFSGRVKYKFLYQLFQCNWCILFWLSVLMSLFINLAIESRAGNLIVPFVVAGLLTLKPRQ